MAFFLVFSYQATAWPYSSFSYDLDMMGLQDEIDDMKRKQECIEQNQREQQDYSECLANCRMFKSSHCFCLSPSPSLC